MIPLLSLVVYMTLLTFLVIMLGAFLRNGEWTPEGLGIGHINGLLRVDFRADSVDWTC